MQFTSAATSPPSLAASRPNHTMLDIRRSESIGVKINATPSSTSPVSLASEEYKYVDPDSALQDDIVCPICCDVFTNVKYTRRCNHNFCYNCILSALSRSKTCPICRAPLRESELRPAIKIQGLLDDLKVYCTYQKDSCNWQGRRGDLRHHLQTLCQFSPVRCNEHPDHPDCKVIMQRLDIEKHRQQCPHKMMSCRLGCERRFYDEVAMEDHCEVECINRQIECSLCTQSFPYHHAREHEQLCPKKIIPCPHRNILGGFAGCNEEIKRHQLTDHLRTCIFEPLKDAFRGIHMHLLALEKKIERTQRDHHNELDLLSTLKLHASDVKSGDQLKNILKYNPSIRAIQGLGFQPGPHWQIFAEVLAENDTIKTVNLKGSKIEKIGAVLLAKDNNIGDQGVEFIAKCLESNHAIRVLNLGGNNIGDKGMELLGRALETPACVLETLDLSCNSFRNKGTEYLARALEQNMSLLTVDLSSNDVSTKGAEWLGRALERNRGVRTLNLAHNRICNKGTEALAHACEMNPVLRMLGLANNNIDDRGAETLAQALAKNMSLQTLDMEGNRIGDLGAECIVRALDRPAYTTVRTIFFWRNNISRDGFKRLTKSAASVRINVDGIKE